MKNWIEENIDPPGMEKKNRRSLFSTIGNIFEIVRQDAEKAYKAHFPYLADLQKLQEHGKSLNIPEFSYDGEDEFRERVSTASFFLSRAGERAYIRQQLERHFGSQYSLTENFLKVTIKIRDIIEEDFIWLHDFFDEMFDPNIMFVIEELFDFTEELTFTDTLKITVRRVTVDVYQNGLKYNGRGKYDGHTLNTIEDNYYVTTPFKYRSGITDLMGLNIS
jgi:hypothetical protein